MSEGTPIPRENGITSKIAIGLIATALVAMFFIPGLAEEGQGPNPQPANKVAVAGSVLEEMSAPLVAGSSSQVVTLLHTEMKTSAPASLIIQVTAECALWTHIFTVGNDDQHAMASVKVWVEMNGVPVPVTSAEEDDDELGKVVFCNRMHRQKTELFENDNATIHQFLRTRTANAFNWVAIEVGADTHTIEVKAQLDVEATDLGDATAAVGKRTLVIEPVKLPPGTEI